MPAWLKDILGEHFTDDVDKKVDAEIGKGFVARADFNTANTDKKTLEATKKTLEDQLETLKKVDPAALQKTIDDLQAANKKQQDDFDASIKQTKFDTALAAALTKANAVNPKAVTALLDLTKVSLDGENLVGLDTQLTALKDSEKWAFTTQNPGRSGNRMGQPPATGDDVTVASEITGAIFGG